MGLNLRPFGQPAEVDTGPVLPPLPGTTGLEGIDKDKIIKLGGIALAVGGGLYILSKTKLGTPGAPTSKPGPTPKVNYTLDIKLTPSTVSVGGSFQATAAVKQDGFIPSSKVRIQANIKGLTDNQEDFLLTDEPEQNFLSAFPVNVGTPLGQYTVTATVISGATILKTATATLTVQAAAGTGGGGGGGAPTPVPAQPTNLTSPFTMAFWTDNIRLNWLNMPGTNWIKFEIEPEPGVDNSDVDRSLFQTQVYEKIQTLSLATPKISNGPYTFLPDTRYIWRVYASSKTDKPSASDNATWSTPSQSEFKTPKANSSGIKPVFPSDKEGNVPSSDDSGGLTLRWANTDQYIFMYEINLSADADFKGQGIGPFIVHAGKQTPKNSWPVTQFARVEPGTKYWWRIRPLVAGTGVPWSNIWTFTTKGAPITPPSPPPGGTPGGGTPGPIAGTVTSLTATPDMTSPARNSIIKVRVQATATAPIINGAVQIASSTLGDFHDETNWNNTTSYDHVFSLPIPSNAPGGNNAVAVTVFSGNSPLRETRFTVNVQVTAPVPTPPPAPTPSPPSVTWKIDGTVVTVTAISDGTVSIWITSYEANGQPNQSLWQRIAIMSKAFGLPDSIDVGPFESQYPNKDIAVALEHMINGEVVETGNPNQAGFTQKLLGIIRRIPTGSPPPLSNPPPSGQPGSTGGGEAIGGNPETASQLRRVYRIR